MMRCAVNINRTDEALEAANDLLKDAKLSPELAIEARYVRAKAYLEEGHGEKALADLKSISEDTRTVSKERKLNICWLDSILIRIRIRRRRLS